MEQKDLLVMMLLILVTPVCIGGNAVSKLNGKLGASHGSMNSNSGSNIEASVTLPVGDDFGFQVDGLYTEVGNVNFSGIGAHLFWRDPKKSMLGIIVGGVFGDYVDSAEISMEGEYYFDRITAGMTAGVSSIKYDINVPFIDTEKRRAVGKLSLGFYPSNDFLISMAAERRFSNSYYSINLEYQLPESGFSFYANAMQGDYDYDHALIGIRYYFGDTKSLKSRHRYDDPQSLMSGILHGIGSYGAEYNARGNAYLKSVVFLTHDSFGNLVTVSGGSHYGSFSSYGATLTAQNISQ